MVPWQPHLETINQSYGNGAEDVVFDRFPMLITELRLLIWQYSLQQPRLLEAIVKLGHGEDAADSRDASPLYSTTNALNKLVSGRNYTFTVQGFPLYSKLLRINRESREAALKFYRLHMPCDFQRSDAYRERTVMTTLYFNPEYDFIHLRHDGPWSHPFIVDFLHDFKAHDPRGVGLINLALGINGMRRLHSLVGISESPAPVKTTLVNFLSHLQEVIWIAHSGTGRTIIEMWNGAFRDVGFQFNHSMPVMGITPGFTRFRRDPRPIGPELKFVLTARSDPRQMRVLWRDLLEKFEICQARPIKERVLFACKVAPHEGLVHNIQTADDFLGREEDSWLRGQETLHYHRVKRYTGKEPPIESPEELAKAVRPAIGFWLFPVEGLGDLEGLHLSGMASGKRVFDMSDHWPELALSALH